MKSTVNNKIKSEIHITKFLFHRSCLPLITSIVRSSKILVISLLFLFSINNIAAQSCHSLIKIVGEPSLCDKINNDASHPLASLDCDGGGIDNITECQNGGDPTDPSDDTGPSCDFDFDMSYTFNEVGTCRFYVTLNCDDTTCPITSWDYDISAGSVSITGTSSSTLNAPTSNSFRPSVLGCGNTIRITRRDFTDNFPAAFGEDINFTLTANSASCGCTKSSSVIIPRLNALTFDNQGT